MNGAKRSTTNTSLGASTLDEDIASAVARTLRTRTYETGLESGAFTREFAEFCGSRYAVAVANRTDALRLALIAAETRPQSEVITVSYGPASTASAIVQLGATPRLVDIDPVTGTMDPEQLEAAINGRTSAIVPVHLHGQVADMDAIIDIAIEHGVAVIEEGSDAVGAIYKDARVGALGDLACFGFDDTASLHATGEGGIVLTDSGELYERLSHLASRTDHTTLPARELGWDTRMDELQAAMLRVKLRFLERSLATGAALEVPRRRPLIPIHRQPAFADRCIAMKLGHTNDRAPSFVQL